MPTSAASKAALLAKLRQAEGYAASLEQLKREVQQAVAQVDVAISGTASRVDQRVLAELRQNLDELERLVAQVRTAVAEGRQFAESL